MLADPTRRRILELLAAGECAAGVLADEFALSQPAVSKHLRVLREAGVVRSQPRGRRRLYRLEPTALAELEEWVQARRRAWESRLDALDAHLEAKRGRKRAGRTK